MAPVDISMPVEADEDEVVAVVAVAAVEVEVAALDRAATSSVLQVLYTVSVAVGSVIHEFKAPKLKSASYDLRRKKRLYLYA